MISVAVQKGSWVYVYNERNQHIFSKEGDLYGFTGATVSVKRGSWVYTYNERGSQISAKSTN